MSIHTPQAAAPGPGDAFSACIQQAIELSRPLLARVVDAALVPMREQAGQVRDYEQRRTLQDSGEMLMRERATLQDQFPQALLAAVKDAVRSQASASGAPAGRDAPALAPLRFEELELMDDLQVQENVALARAVQSALLSCERELAALDARICGAQGLPAVRSDRNPLRPQTYAAALRQAIGQTGVPPAQRLVWMQHLGAALGQQLGAVYAELTRALQARGVQPAAYWVTPAAGAPGTSGAAGAGGPAGAGASASAAAAPAAGRAPTRGATRWRDRPGAIRITASQLHALLTGRSGPQTLDSSIPPTDSALLESWDAAATPLGALPPSALPAGASPAASPAQPAPPPAAESALAQEVVRLMVENLCDDARLLPGIRLLVQDLEPALVALALQDPHFLHDKAHPALVMLDRLTQRSLAFDSEDADGYSRLMHTAYQAVQAVLAAPPSQARAAVFAEVLAKLERTWARHDEAARAPQEQAVQALLKAEQRGLLAERIARKFERRADVRTAPAFVRQFLAGPWAQVLALEQLARRSGPPDPNGYEGVAVELVWSTQAHLCGRNLARLVRVVPAMLRTLREGLQTVGYPVEQTGEFLAQLMTQHQAILQAPQEPQAAAAVGRPPRPASEAGVDAETEAEAAPPPTREQLEAELARGDQAWLAPQEAEDSGFMDTEMALSATQPMPLEQGSTGAPTVTASAAMAAAPSTSAPAPHPPLSPAELALGTWVELLVAGQWTRAQLTWNSPTGSLFMFSGTGGRPHSATRRMLDKMIETGGLRIISQASMVTGALDAVAQTALRNSLDLEI